MPQYKGMSGQGVGGLVCMGRVNGISCFQRGNQEKGLTLEMQIRKYLIIKKNLFKFNTRALLWFECIFSFRGSYVGNMALSLAV